MGELKLYPYPSTGRFKTRKEKEKEKGTEMHTIKDIMLVTKQHLLVTDSTKGYNPTSTGTFFYISRQLSKRGIRVINLACPRRGAAYLWHIHLTQVDPKGVGHSREVEALEPLLRGQKHLREHI